MAANSRTGSPTTLSAFQRRLASVTARRRHTAGPWHGGVGNAGRPLRCLLELAPGCSRWRSSRIRRYERCCQCPGSGWAGTSGYDWAVLDPAVVAQRALDKCVQSLNPVAIEPGRYVAILEPQAVFEFAYELFRSFGGRWHRYEDATKPPGVWTEEDDPTLGMRMTKLGQMVVDERITITTDPMDPRLGNIPARGLGPA